MLGPKVLAGVPEAPPQGANDSILLRAASRVLLEGHEVAISNGDGGGAGGNSGGLWVKDSALTGRADEHVLLQAGGSSFATGGG